MSEEPTLFVTLKVTVGDNKYGYNHAEYTTGTAELELEFTSLEQISLLDLGNTHAHLLPLATLKYAGQVAKKANEAKEDEEE